MPASRPRADATRLSRSAREYTFRPNRSAAASSISTHGIAALMVCSVQP
ncbi:Uncharacterised protein [Bordetella pertussis]|nr:Uncharacterised protein [Bordetella pertussis]CFO31648.1 Uncharacterised protein [Bordetella pertussis]CFW37565.1 Uncharacterised protein [Bordetella pertussis]